GTIPQPAGSGRMIRFLLELAKQLISWASRGCQQTARIVAGLHSAVVHLQEIAAVSHIVDDRHQVIGPHHFRDVGLFAIFGPELVEKPVPRYDVEILMIATSEVDS